MTPFGRPDGCLGGDFPAMHALIPLWQHDRAF